jgi:hypothetical protein
MQILLETVLPYVVIGFLILFFSLHRWLLLPVRLRRAIRIAVRPVVGPMGEEDLQPAMRTFLGRAAPLLVTEGFKPCASVHAPRFGTTMKWTQALFIEPDTGHRASIICFQEDRIYWIRLIFATEHANGAKVLTPSTTLDSSQIDVRGQLQRHREKVQEQCWPDGAKILPSPGDELNWLGSRAAMVAAGMARTAGFAPEPVGEWYVLTWRRAVEIAIKRWQHRRGRRPARQSPPGFAPILSAGKGMPGSDVPS